MMKPVRTTSYAMDQADKTVPGVSRLWREAGEALNEAVRLNGQGKEAEALQKIAYARGVQHAIDIVLNLQ
jgi:hypothetical protein